MAVIETPQGRVIGLIVEKDILNPDLDEKESVFAEEEPPKRPGRPKKSQ